MRATLLVRLARSPRGGGGHAARGRRRARRAARRRPRCRSLRDLGGIGTGDLTVLAQLGLALRRARWAEGDALPLMSSNAATFAVASARLGRPARAARRRARRRGAVLPRAARQRRGLRRARRRGPAAARARRGLARRCARSPRGAAPSRPGSRTRSALRCLPPVGGALHEALEALHGVLAVELDAAAENPLVAGDDVLPPRRLPRRARSRSRSTPRGSRSCRSPSLSLARLSAPDGAASSPGSTPFLSVGAPGSSGLMIAEYLGGRRARAAARRRRARDARAASRSRAGWRSTPLRLAGRAAGAATPSGTCARCSRSSTSRPAARSTRPPPTTRRSPATSPAPRPSSRGSPRRRATRPELGRCIGAESATPARATARAPPGRRGWYERVDDGRARSASRQLGIKRIECRSGRRPRRRSRRRSRRPARGSRAVATRATAVATSATVARVERGAAI